MAEIQLNAKSRSRRVPALLIVLGAVGAAKAASWFYFRRQQPVTDELTRERLQPRSSRS
jgi:hypothetical protein